MAEAWYDPAELKEQADGDKTQPEFAPAPTVIDTEEIDPEGVVLAIVTIVNALAQDIEDKLGGTY